MSDQTTEVCFCGYYFQVKKDIAIELNNLRDAGRDFSVIENQSGVFLQFDDASFNLCTMQIASYSIC